MLEPVSAAMRSYTASTLESRSGSLPAPSLRCQTDSRTIRAAAHVRVTEGRALSHAVVTISEMLSPLAAIIAFAAVTS